MRRLIAAALCLSLAACMTAGRRGADAAPAVYDWGPTPAVAGVSRPLPMALEVRASPWFDTSGIDYRLAYADPARLREYAQARWAAPPAQLVQQRLAGRLGLMPAGVGRADCLLRIEIGEFSQVFASPESSRGVLQGRVALFDRSRRLLATLPVDIAMPAATPDARGGVGALGDAVDRLADAISAWEASLADGTASGCFR